MSKFIPLDHQDCTLLSNQVDVWQYSLNATTPGAKALLDTDQQKRADRFIFHKHRRRFITAHAFVRIILAKYLNVKATQLTFTYNAHGKPALSSHPFLQFNLTHSHDLALLAIGLDYPLGIDVEFFSPRPYAGIGSHIFSKREMHELNALPKALKPMGFFNLWTQKEALIKACGLGLSYPTQDFDVPALPSSKEHIQDVLHQKTWQMFSFTPQPASHAALCCDESINQARYAVLTETEIGIFTSGHAN